MQEPSPSAEKIVRLTAQIFALLAGAVATIFASLTPASDMWIAIVTWIFAVIAMVALRHRNEES